MRFLRAGFGTVICSCLILTIFGVHGYAEEGGTSLEKTLPGSSPGQANSGGGTTVLPDLFTGSMSYSFPIEVPPGRKGMQPNLSLTYRSSNGDGVAGVGWELEVGAIERKTTPGVDYNGDNYVFRMAGAVGDLVRRTGTAPGNGIFAPKIEGTFTRFEKIDSYWVATDKTGTRYRFGFAASSRQDGSPGIFKWCLDEVTDTNDNKMTLTYWKDLESGQIYLDQIDYTDPGPTNQVKFYWGSRPDLFQTFTPGFKSRTDYRLKSIDVSGNGSRVRAYALSYVNTTSTARSLLSSITPYDKNASVNGSGDVSGGSTLPPLSFEYSDISLGLQDDEDWVTSPYTTWYSVPDLVRNVDVNGDGKSDIVLGPDSAGDWHVLLSTGSSFDVGTGQPWAVNKYESFRHYPERIRNADVNGDGKSDVVLGPDSSGDWYVLLSTGTSFDAGNGQPWADNQYESFEYAPERVRNADVNGDGKSDIVLGPDSSGDWHVMLSTGSSFDVGTGQPWADNKYAAWWDDSALIRNIDVNGDGKSDVLLGPDNTGKWYLLRSTGTSFVDEGVWVATSYGSWASYPNLVRNADVDGDGKADIVIGPDENGKWNVLLSTGTTFSIDGGGEWIDSLYHTWSDDTGLIRNMDMNGDGKSDILLGPNENGQWYILLSTGTSFVDKGEKLTNKYGNWAASSNRIRNADVDGDGKADVVIGPDSSGKWYVMRTNPGIPDLLTSISNGIGGTTTIVYKPSTEYAGPQTQLPFPVQTVYTITTNDGTGNSSVAQYDYSGGYFHIGERDFRGFHDVKVTGPAGPNGERALTET